MYIRFSARLACAAALVLGAPAYAQQLTLAEALSRASGTDPTTAANAAHQQAADAAIAQADARPQDTIGGEIENFAGTGDYTPVRRAESTVWYERTWERGGKREARITAARASVDTAVLRGRVRTLDLMYRVQTAWVEALAAEAAITVAESRLADARRVETETGRRVARALDPLFAAERAKTTSAQARIALDQARETARNARAALAAYWGGSADYALDRPAFDIAPDAAPSAETSPDVALAGAELTAAATRVRLAETGNVGDPSARVGLRHFVQGSDVALMVGGSIPLGNHAANRGNVDRARAEQSAAEAEVAVTRAEQQREIDRLVAERAALTGEVARIEREVLPGAERAVVMVRDGFARGGTAFTFLEVSQASQAVIDARSRRIDLLRRYHLAGARIDRLTGRHAGLISSVENR